MVADASGTRRAGRGSSGSAHVAALWSVAFSPDGTRLATGGKEGIVRVFDAADGRERAALFTGCQNVSGLAFSPDGRRLHAAGWGMGGVKVFDPARDPRGRGFRAERRSDRGPDLRSRGPPGPRDRLGRAACWPPPTRSTAP